MQLLDRLKSRIDTKNDRSASATIPPSDCYSLLSNERRRLIIEHLATMDGDSTDAASISDHLAELGDDRTNSYVSCIQQHLPRLAQSGVIAYDERSKEVTVNLELKAVHDAHQAVEDALD
jgi:predicted transcriptional regulator